MWVVILSLLCCLLVPSNAFAAVEDYETALMNPEQLYQYEYEPEYVEDNTVRSAPVLDENATTVDWVNSTFDSFNTVNLDTGSSIAKRDLLTSVRVFTGTTSFGGFTGMKEYVVMIPVGIVFLYWGVRKSVRMIMKALRKGGASL